jgi:hypothetical protein
VQLTRERGQQAPSGTGGDATAANQAAIIVDLDDLKGSGFVKNTDSMVDLAHAASLSTTDGKVDDILEDTGTTLSNKLDTVVTVVGDTESAVGDVDTVVDLIMDILEGDHEINDAGSPYLHVIKRKGTSDVLVSKELYELDDTAITAITQAVSKELEA